MLLKIYTNLEGEMRKYEKFAAFVMASVLGVAAMADVDIIRAEAAVQENGQEQEYVVLAKNDKGIERIENAYGEEIVKKPEELDGSHIAVVELTEHEAVKLERDRNILLVEEDILFEGSSFLEGDTEEIQLEEIDFEETEIEEIDQKETEQEETGLAGTVLEEIEQ